jgi:hypothetical protein
MASDSFNFCLFVKERKNENGKVASDLSFKGWFSGLWLI